ncbi:lengsin [Strongylocentrotus purpuratus]|uniref:Lengsin n=1 Tax=Strongylocentrotus purpuratus TaxID=7668 RepID=A0A7M7THH7_STRPU|nr:lengsin [Strongylocentrotus purpuratus]
MGLTYSFSSPSQETGSSIIDLPEDQTVTRSGEGNGHGSEAMARILNDVKQRGIKVLRVEFTDINCITRCKMVAVHSLDELTSNLTRGFLFSPLYFFKDPAGNTFESNFKRKYYFTDFCALPALDTYSVIPWLEDTARVTSALYHLNMTDLVVEHPRNVAEKQLRRLESLGFSLLSAYESEFRLSDAKGQELVAERMSFGGSTVLLLKVKDYIKQLFDCLPQVGVLVNTIHAETSAGALEVATEPSFGIKAADDAVMVRNTCKDIALCNGYTAHFLADPNWNAHGFCLDFNHSLWDKTGNVISNKTGDLTDTAKHWIAGLLAHARALTPLSAPTVNGIKMFGAYQPPNHNEPSFITWGRYNRSVTFRVKSSGGPTGSYIENRLGRSDADPYLLLAGTIAAGLDGIINKLTLPSECTGDAHTDIPPGTPRLPFEMEEGVTALVEDKVLCEALGKDFVDLIVASRRHEIELYNTNKTDI